MPAETCPFCGAQAGGALCSNCGRDPSARRQVCVKCKGMTPSAEPQCCHCGALVRSELRWKIPAIIVVFASAFAVAFAFRYLSG
jgi:predicted amidophosphoribosyltransferase